MPFRLLPIPSSVNMCNIAVATEPRSGLMVDPWEAFQSYQRTAVVLDHFDYELNEVLGGIEAADGEGKRRVRVMLLAGSDLISTMSEPGVWLEADVSNLDRFRDHLFSLWSFDFLSSSTSWGGMGRS